jgi:hypothetical protein
VTSPLAGFSDALRETTAIGAVAGRPSSVRSRPTGESAATARYPSVDAVPCPTRTTSVGEEPAHVSGC